MKKNTQHRSLRGIAAGLLMLGICGGLFAQAPGEVKEVRKIRMVTVENGDTTIVERELGPDEELPVWHSEDEEDHVIHHKMRVVVDGEEGEEMPEEIELMIEELKNGDMEGEEGHHVIIRRVEVENGETVVDERIVRELEAGEVPGEMRIEIKVDENGEGGHDMIFIEDEDETTDGEKHVRVIRRVDGDDVSVIHTQCTLIWITDAAEEETEVLPREAGASNSELEPGHFNFFPNPNEGRFTLDMELPSENPAEIRIYDLQGKQVYEDSHAGSTQYKKEIDISAFPKGAYLLEVSQDGRRMVRKIVTQ